MKSKVLSVIIGVSLLVISLFLSIPEIQNMYNEISGIKSFYNVKEGKYILDLSNNADLSDESGFNKKIADNFFEELNKEFKASIEFRFLPVIINGKEVKYIFVNHDFFYDNFLKYHKGNGFSESSFSRDNNLEIIVGYNLKDDYSLGSKHIIETIGQRFNAEVISILEKGSFYRSITKNYLDLNNAIIIPFDVNFAKKYFKYPEYVMSYQNILISTNREDSLINLFEKDNGVINTEVKSLEDAIGDIEMFSIDDLFKLLIILSIILTPILIILCSTRFYRSKLTMFIVTIVNSIVIVKYITLLLSQNRVNFGIVNVYVLVINIIGLFISLKLINNIAKKN